MINVQNLTKTYGTFEALKGISFEIDKGEVVGFLGPNGAGKTTTMRIMTVSGYLNYVAQIKGVPYQQKSERLDFVLEACGLTDRRRQITGQLSKGFRQRVGLAQSLIHDPEVIILDEPTSGLDPRQIIEIRKLIRQLGQNRTVILSTHILAEASMTCQRMLVIHQGKIAGDVQLVDQKPVLRTNDANSTANEQYVRLVVRGELKTVKNTLNQLKLAYTRTNQDNNKSYTFQLALGNNSEESKDLRPKIAEALVHEGCQLLEMAVVESTLEEIFLQLTTG